MSESLGTQAGPLDPVLEELQADYHAIASLVGAVHSRAASIAYELTKARPNVDTIRGDAVRISQCCKSLKRIMQLPEVS